MTFIEKLQELFWPPLAKAPMTDEKPTPDNPFAQAWPKSPQETQQTRYLDELKSDVKVLTSRLFWWSFFGSRGGGRSSSYTVDQFEDRAIKDDLLVRRMKKKYPFIELG